MTDAFAVAPTSTPVRRRRDWRQGGRTVKPWDEMVLAIVLMLLGGSLLASAAIRNLDPGPMASVTASGVVLLAMLIAVALAFRRANPRPLLRFRAVDVVYGLAAGLALRLIQGGLAVAAGDDGGFPSYSALFERMGRAGAALDIGAHVVVAPVIEEVFLRGVLLVTTYSVVRRMTGRAAATCAALVISAAASVTLHAWNAGIAWEAWATPAMISLVAGAVVLLTGRIWGAVLAHLVFTVSYAALSLVGTSWA